LGWLDSSPVEINKIRHNLLKPAWGGVNTYMTSCMALVTSCAYEGHNPWETVYINVLREGIKLSIIFFCNQQLCGIAIKGVFLSLGSHIWLGRLSSNFELDWFFKTNCFYKWNFRDANHFETIFCVPTCHVIWNCSKLKSIVY